MSSKVNEFESESGHCTLTCNIPSPRVTGAAKLQQVQRQLEGVKSDNIRLETGDLP